MQRILLLGAGDLADELRAALELLDTEVVRLPEPTTRELEDMFGRHDFDRVLVNYCEWL